MHSQAKETRGANCITAESKQHLTLDLGTSTLERKQNEYKTSLHIKIMCLGDFYDLSCVNVHTYITEPYAE